MELADRCRHAAREAVSDVEPPALASILSTVLDDASMVPSVLAFEVAQEVTDGLQQPDDSLSETVVHRAVGVQLIYEGLRLTRRLGQEPPWERPSPPPVADCQRETGEDAVDVDTVEGEAVDVDAVDVEAAALKGRDGGVESNGSMSGTESPVAAPIEVTDGDGGSPPVAVGGEPIHADLEILAADILVARGFYLLARTTAADKAVRTVRTFGREQMRAREGEDKAVYDRTLERDVLDLAVLAGAAAVDGQPKPHQFAIATRIVDQTDGSFPPVDGPLLDSSPLDDVTTTGRATSVSDP